MWCGGYVIWPDANSANAMDTYAQTNIQLFDQLQHEGYTEDELNVIRDTYALATRLFTGLFRPSGKTFVAHAVGIASILGSNRFLRPSSGSGRTKA